MTPEDVRTIAERVIDDLPDEIAERVEDCVRIEVRSQPTEADLARGVGPDWVAYFHGVPMSDDTSELVLETGSDLAQEVPSGDVGGVIVLFSGQLETADDVERALLHELAHFLGEDEDEVSELGLGEFEDEEIEVEEC